VLYMLALLLTAFIILFVLAGREKPPNVPRACRKTSRRPLRWPRSRRLAAVDASSVPGPRPMEKTPPRRKHPFPPPALLRHHGRDPTTPAAAVTLRPLPPGAVTPARLRRRLQVAAGRPQSPCRALCPRAVVLAAVVVVVVVLARSSLLPWRNGVRQPLRPRIKLR
jgi:hypothetical protein